MTKKIVARAICEAMEPRRYLSVGFAAPVKLTVTGATAPLDEAFFTGNSNPVDLAVATSSSVQILIGNNDGTFTVGDSIPLPVNPTAGKSFLPGTFSSNGSENIVLLSQTTATLNGVSAQEGVITYETNNGTGSFTTGSTSVITDNNLGFIPINATIGDFNGDGNDDLAVLGKPGSGSQLVLAIMTSNGAGGFSETADYSITGSNSSGNLSNELILSGPLTSGNAGVLIEDASGGSGNLDVFTGNGTGPLTQLTPVALNATFITAGRFTPSASADLVTATTNTITTLLGNGDGTFTALPTQPVDGTINALGSADFDQDGNRDIVTNLGVQLGNGDGTFQSPIALPGLGGGAVFANAIVAGNINDDGTPDIVGFSSAGNTIASAVNASLVVTTTNLESSDLLANPGDDVMFTATVSSQLGGTPSGTVEFFDSATDLGSAPLVNASTTFDAGTGLAVGSHSITAQYNGDSTFGPSISTALTQTVLAPSTVAVTSNENPSNIGQDITFTATVSGNDGGGDVPSGDVDFLSNGVNVGSGSLNQSGQAVFDTASLSIGTHAITAQYLGDAHYSASTTTSSLTQTVNEPALVPQVTTTTLPATLVGTTPVHAKATVKLTNETGSLITGPAIVVIFASTNGAVTDSTPVLATLPVHKIKIASGATMTVTVPIKQSSISLPAGDYTLLAQVSYNSNTIIKATIGTALTIDAPFIALSDVLTVQKLPSSVVSGGKTPATATIKLTNGGTITSSGKVTIALSASIQQGVVGTPIISVTKMLSIKPAATKSITIPLKTIPLLADGDYFIVLQTTDPDGNTSVASTVTAVTAASPFISLSAAITAVTPISVAVGKSVSFAVTITNSGNIPATGPATFDLGVSTDGQTLAATLVDLVKAVTLAPGATKSMALTFKIPSGTATGAFFPAVTVNQKSQVVTAVGLTSFTIT
jgi:hypothetical protein